MHESPDTAITSPTVTRRAIVRTGVRLAYAAPLVSASFGLIPLRAGAADALSADNAAAAAANAAAKNTPPVAVPGDGFEVVDADGDGVEAVTVDGSASADPDGTIASYLWSLNGTWLSSDAAATVTLPVGTHRLLLTVTDDQGATDSAKIRIRVKKGVDASKQSAQTTDAETAPTPTAAPALPPAPYGVKAKQKLAEVAVTWKVDPSTPTPYRIYRTIDDGLNRPLDELDWTLLSEEWEKLSYRDAAVEIGVPYLYVVRSFDGVNESKRSNVAAITLAPVSEPAVDNQVVDAPTVDEVPPTEVPTEIPIEPTDVPTEVPTEAPVVDQSATDDESTGSEAAPTVADGS